MTLDRPENLYQLFKDIESLRGIGGATKVLLGKLEIRLVRDLIFNLPRSILERTRVTSVADVVPPTVVTVPVEVGRHLPGSVAGHPYKIELHDPETTFKLVYFGNRRPYFESRHPTGCLRLVSGKLEQFGDELQMVHPDYLVPETEGHLIPDREPVYRLTDGLSNKAMKKFIASALECLPDLPEWHDREFLNRKHWSGWRNSILTVHSSDGGVSSEDRSNALLRLAFDELMANQLALLVRRRHLRNSPASEVKCGTGLRRQVVAEFGHELTKSQLKVLREIEVDLGRPERMIRLLQGDVGSGKTIVALLALLAVVESGGQGVLIAPTEILVRQHFSEFQRLLGRTPVNIDILAGRDHRADRREKLEALKSGKTGILLGTHAVFQQGVEFRNLRLAIVDEQHRFGVGQRRALLGTNPAANLLMMTATPIPRTLALINYGDSDISELRGKPAGRREIKTAILSARRIDQVINRLRTAIDRGRQAYWICPAVEESADARYAATEHRAASLAETIGGRVGLVHGQMPHEQRDEVMNRFHKGEIAVLVATTVVEVGMDVPNASIMVIESAELFGLTQLHQLRGRVGRGEHPSACVMIYNQPLGELAERRLSIIRDTEDGFRIADADLELRGAGDLVGERQSGELSLICADPVAQATLVDEARIQASGLIESRPDLATDRGSPARDLLFLFGYDRILPAINP